MAIVSIDVCLRRFLKARSARDSAVDGC
jgi:hypothetical protein